MARTADTRLLWQIALFGIVLIILFAFLRDIIASNWPAWVLSPAFVFGFYGVVSKIDEGSLVRAILWQAALTAVAFAGVYNALDLVIGPDWPLWLISPVIVVGAWAGLFIVVGAMDDS